MEAWRGVVHAAPQLARGCTGTPGQAALITPDPETRPGRDPERAPERAPRVPLGANSRQCGGEKGGGSEPSPHHEATLLLLLLRASASTVSWE